MVSWIQSVSQVWIGRGGRHGLHAAGSWFRIRARSRVILTFWWAKAAVHTIIPAHDGTPAIVTLRFGIMGGPNQPLAHAQFVSDVVDNGMNVQEALETARWTKTEAAGCTVSIEDAGAAF